MAGKRDFMVGTLFINGGEFGLSEKYFLPQVAYADAQTNFLNLCKWRGNLLGDDFKLVWARVSYPDSERDSKAVLGAPIGPLDPTASDREDSGFGVVNKTQDALLFRFETAEGKWATRRIAGIPDVDVTDDAIVGSLTLVSTAAVTIPTAIGAGVTFLTQLANFVAYVRANTIHPVLRKGTAGTYDLFAWDRVVYRRTAIKKAGRPFVS